MSTITILYMRHSTYMSHTSYHYRWHNCISQNIFISICIFKIKSSSTWLIHASLCEGPFFYFYVESSKFMHQLREHSCHSECNVHSPKTYWLTDDVVYCLFLNYLFLVTLLNFKGVLAFMFCFIIKDKLSTTLLCLLYAQTNKLLPMHYYSWSFVELLFML